MSKKYTTIEAITALIEDKSKVFMIEDLKLYRNEGGIFLKTVDGFNDYFQLTEGNFQRKWTLEPQEINFEDAMIECCANRKTIKSVVSERKFNTISSLTNTAMALYNLKRDEIKGKWIVLEE